MAVTTTYEEIIEAAYAKSLRNMPGVIASESTELLQTAVRALRGLYAVAARVNRTFFAEKTAAVAHDGEGWPLPAGVESLFRLEGEGATGGVVAAGEKVSVVPFDDRKAEELKPSVYFFGQRFYPAGNGSDPNASDTLAAFHAKRPADPTGLSDTLDPLWTEQFNELLILEVAVYLELKRDESQSPLQELKQQRDDWARRFVMHLEHVVPIEVRRTGHVQRFNTNTLVPMSSLFAGGSEALAG